MCWWVASISLASLSQSRSRWFSPMDSPVIPMVSGQSRGSHKMTHSAGGVGFLLGSHFLLEEPEVQARLRCTVTRWSGGGATWSTCSCLSYPTDAVCLGFCGAAGCFSLTPMFQSSFSGVFLNSCLVLPVRGNEVRNNLCHHLDHVTLSSKSRSGCSSFLLRF